MRYLAKYFFSTTSQLTMSKLTRYTSFDALKRAADSPVAAVADAKKLLLRQPLAAQAQQAATLLHTLRQQRKRCDANQ